MGADGGVNWVKVKDRKKLEKLLMPFGLLWEGGSYYDEHHYEYLNQNPLPSDYVISRYSNLKGYNYGLLDLQEILNDIESWAEVYEKDSFDPYFRDANLLEMSWEDVLEDYYTHPDSSHWAAPRLVTLLVEELGFWFKHGKSSDRPGREVLEMKIGQWYQEVIACIDPDTFGSAETWT